MKLVGYADRWSAQARERLTVMVSSEHPSFHASLVRLIHGDTNPAGPGFKSEPVEAAFEGDYDGIVQTLRTGSYVRVPHRAGLAPTGGFTVGMWVMATAPERGSQTLVSHRGEDGTGYALRLEEGRVALHLGRQHIQSERLLSPRVWYFIAASYDAASERATLLIDQTSGIAVEQAEVVRGTLPPSLLTGDADLLIAAEPVDANETRPGNLFNGKIDSPFVFDRALGEGELTALRKGSEGEVAAAPVARWDFSRDISGWNVTDTSGHGYHGSTVNKPTRAVTGWNWDGTEFAWSRAPHQYAAIHFHDDDLADAGWEPAFEWTVPDDLPSGVYAVQLMSGEDEDFIPFAVTPELGRPEAKIAVVLPLFSYLAYGNEQMANGGTLAGQVEDYPREPEDAYIVETGLRSLYDRHTDGSGVYHASWLRPIVNMRPKYRQAWLDNGKGSLHQLPADLHLIDWLVSKGYRFDVLTDLEVHRDGVARLGDYRVVLTGTHAEYCSGEMIDAYEGFMRSGGRLMYLSGNGMWWVTQVDPDTGTSIEMRRYGTPMWVWPVPPGEAYLSSTGELGGLWGDRGRAPQTWLAVGMNSEGAGPGRPYRRLPASFDPRAAFVFEGVADDELIGDFPALVNSWGAAGFEFDYADPKWGTPPHALVLAQADGFCADYELNGGNLRGGAAQHPAVEAHMALVEYPNNGMVFSTGSITWCSCLSYNSYDNNVSKITENVLNEFLGDQPSS
jgi:N,N-dimethylformamidase